MSSYSVYEHICPNGKIYIGITARKPETRWGKCGIGYKAHNKHFYSAILKYGWDNIEHKILFSGISKEEACKIEKTLIKRYKSNDRNFGYNKSTGGESPSAGVHRVISEETRKKISETQKGKVIPPEIIKKMHDNRKGWKNPEEVRQKISNATKIPVIQYDLEHNIIKEYESILCASIETNVAKQNICKCCKGERQRAGGFIWEYKIAGSSHKKKRTTFTENGIRTQHKVL